MAGRSVRVISLGDPNDVACMDEGVRVIAVNPSGQQSQMVPMGPSCQSSLTRVYCGPVETIGMPAPPEDQGLAPRLAHHARWPSRGDRWPTADQGRRREAPPPDIDKLKKSLCDPLSLLANKRLPICFETTLGQETAPGLTSVTVINEQPGNPVMVQPRALPAPSSRGCSPPGLQIICSSDGGYGGYQPPTVTTCSAMGGGGGGNFAGVRIRADSSSSCGRRCEQLLPEPCPAMQTIRIVDDVGAANRRTSSRVVHIFEEPSTPPRSTRGSSRDRQVTARVVHIEEDCPDLE
ncbi:hypothetical protein MRX96_018863 [Rhipicephalus microplus]